MNLRKFMWWQKTPHIVVRPFLCEDRGTRELEYLLPELELRGGCNSSHGGSCCVCGGPLPDTHTHLNAECHSCNIRGQEGDYFGGNVCSDNCFVVFIRWLENEPPRLAICPGHWGGAKVFGSWGHHRRHIVEVEERRAR